MSITKMILYGLLSSVIFFIFVFSFGQMIGLAIFKVSAPELIPVMGLITLCGVVVAFFSLIIYKINKLQDDINQLKEQK